MHVVVGSRGTIINPPIVVSKETADAMAEQFILRLETETRNRNILLLESFKIQQDPYGFIWVATVNGLNKFDGIRFTHFSNLSKENFIPQNYISELLITKDSLIWMAGENNLTTLDIRNFNVKKINTHISNDSFQN